MILTETEYNDMWTDDFGKPIHTVPPYNEYLQREVYQQDYLDLFGASKTITYPRTNSGGAWMVNIEGREIKVDYDYPFKEEIKKASVRKLKYVLVGEAPFIGNTYFYNCSHGSSPYINAPLTAFGGGLGLTKTEKLLYLAERGVVLFDLFPFAIVYNNQLRRHLRATALKRFHAIIEILNGICDKLDFNDLKFSFLCSIGKNGHAEYIIENVFGGHGKVVLCDRSFVINDSTASSWAVWGVYPHSVLGPIIGLWHAITPSAAGLNFIHRYKSIGKSKSYLPHEVSIRFAFNLP